MFAKRLSEFQSTGKGPRGTVHISKGKDSNNDILEQLKKLEKKLDEVLAKLQK